MENQTGQKVICVITDEPEDFEEEFAGTGTEITVYMPDEGDKDEPDGEEEE